MNETTPLGEQLRALAPPLEYLAADDFRRVQQTHLPLPVLAERVARARTAASPAAAATLAELERILAELASGPPREELFRRAHALLPLLRDAAAAPVPWSDYRPVADPVAAALETLARPVEAIRGVGPQRAAQLTRFGLRTVEDALYHLPFRYEDRRALRPPASLRVGEAATAAGEVAPGREGRRPTAGHRAPAGAPPRARPAARGGSGGAGSGTLAGPPLPHLRRALLPPARAGAPAAGGGRGAGHGLPALDRPGAGVPRPAPVRADDGAGARVRRDRDRPRGSPSHAPPLAGRRRQREDAGRAPRRPGRDRGGPSGS